MENKAKFNLLDCLIVAVVLFVILAGIYFIGSLRDTGKRSGQEPAKIRFQVELTKKGEEVLEKFVDAGEKQDSCTVSEREKAPAIIKEVTYTPSRTLAVDGKSDEAFYSENEDLYDITVVIEADGTVTDENITAGQGAVVKVGDEISVKGKGYAGYGFITGLEVIEQEG